MTLLDSFEPLTQSELEALWTDGLFVFDTSLLLNLHRYRDSVREDFLKGIGVIKNQIWIPFHVAIEYEFNRPKVIADKRRVIEKTRSKVASIADEVRGHLSEVGAFRRHSHIDAEDLVIKIKTATEEFCKSLENLSAETPDVTKPDAVGKQIQQLFYGRIGQPPKSQEEVIKLDDLADARFSIKYPPGYLDQQKKDSKESAFGYGGFIYQRQNGDFYIWDQIKNKAKHDNHKSICFVTDDQKEDWWWMIDSDGTKRLGPRPELREELRRECGVDVFNIHGPDSFLEALTRFKHIGFKPETITEARELSQERRRLKTGSGLFGLRAQMAVVKWCEAKVISGTLIQSAVFPDVIELDADDTVIRGFEVIPVVAPILDVEQRVERRMDDIKKFLTDNPGADLRLMFVFKDATSANAQLSTVGLFDELPSGVTRCVGYIAGGFYRHLKCFLTAEI